MVVLRWLLNIRADLCDRRVGLCAASYRQPCIAAAPAQRFGGRRAVSLGLANVAGCRCRRRRHRIVRASADHRRRRRRDRACGRLCADGVDSHAPQFRSGLRPRNDVPLFIAAAAAGMVLMPTFGYLGYALAGITARASNPVNWIRWWINATAGVLLVAPGLVALNRKSLVADQATLDRRKRLDRRNSAVLRGHFERTGRTRQADHLRILDASDRREHHPLRPRRVGRRGFRDVDAGGLLLRLQSRGLRAGRRAAGSRVDLVFRSFALRREPNHHRAARGAGCSGTRDTARRAALRADLQRQSPADLGPRPGQPPISDDQ